MSKVIDADHFRTRAARGLGGSDGGGMDDVLRRPGVVESLAGQTREDVSAIKGGFMHLATKADLNELKGDVNAINAALPHLATRAELNELKADVREIKATLPHLATQAEITGVRSDLSALETGSFAG